MIEPALDRLDYGAMLAPPADGYELNNAVACTYSLDLTALMAAMLPLGFGGDALDGCHDNPVFMLHALKKILPKLFVFCDASEIKYPEVKDSKLLNMLDQVVFPVNRKTAFHPKFWLLKYVKGKDIRYRLVILSKNISFDRCWDVAMCFEGIPQESPGNGAPLADMLIFLKRKQWGKADQLTRLSELAEEIRFVSFGNEEIKPDSFSLIPFGIGENRNEWPFQRKYDRMLVMSPLLTESVVSDLFQKSQGTKILFTRKEALAGFSKETLEGIDCYCIRDEIFNGEHSGMLAQTMTNGQNQDIHAKIHLLQGNGTKQDLFIGSSNLTVNGLSGKNVELLVGVKFRSHNIFETMCKDLLHDGKNDAAFVSCQPEALRKKSESEENMDKLKKEFKNLLAIRIKASLEEDEEKRFIVRLRAEKTYSVKYDLEIAPVGGGIPQAVASGQSLPGEICFVLSLETLSNFYLVTMYLGEARLKRIVFIDTLSQDALKKRDEAMEKSCLKNTGQLMEYLNYMLADDAYSEAILRGSSAGNDHGLPTINTSMSGIYERMLSCAAHESSRLQRIKDVIGHSTIKDADLDGLLRMCDLFCKIAGDAK